MGKRKKFTPSDTTDPGGPRRRIPGPPGVMQHPSSVHRAAFSASPAQATADTRGCPSLPFLFSAGGYGQQRSAPAPWASQPTPHAWAGKAEMSAVSYGKEPAQRRCPLSSASTGRPWAGAPKQPPNSSCSNYFASSQQLLCGAAALRAEQGVLLPCNHPAPLQLSNWHCFDGLKPSNHLLTCKA